MDKRKKNVLLIISFVLGALYMAYSAWYWLGGSVSVGTESAEQVGGALATALVAPHLLLTLIAVIFNALALFLNKRGFALTAGILYAVAMVLFPMYFFFVIIQMILCFVAFAKMRKQSGKAA